MVLVECGTSNAINYQGCLKPTIDGKSLGVVYGIGSTNFFVDFPMTGMIIPISRRFFFHKNGSTTNQATDAPSESTSAPSTTDLADFPATSLPVVHQWTVQRGTTGGDFGRAMQVGCWSRMTSGSEWI